MGGMVMEIKKELMGKEEEKREREGNNYRENENRKVMLEDCRDICKWRVPWVITKWPHCRLANSK